MRVSARRGAVSKQLGASIAERGHASAGRRLAALARSGGKHCSSAGWVAHRKAWHRKAVSRRVHVHGTHNPHAKEQRAHAIMCQLIARMHAVLNPEAVSAGPRFFF